MEAWRVRSETRSARGSQASTSPPRAIAARKAVEIVSRPDGQRPQQLGRGGEEGGRGRAALPRLPGSDPTESAVSQEALSTLATAADSAPPSSAGASRQKGADPRLLGQGTVGALLERDAGAAERLDQRRRLGLGAVEDRHVVEGQLVSLPRSPTRPLSKEKEDVPPSSLSRVWTTSSASARSVAARWMHDRARPAPSRTATSRRSGTRLAGRIAWQAASTRVRVER